MSNIQMVLYLLALLSIYGLATALDQQAEQSDLQPAARVDALRCVRTTTLRSARQSSEAAASAVLSAC